MRDETNYSNCPAGYDMTARVNPWWRHPVFPLVPQYQWRPGDEWNASNWFFSWLWFRIWSLEHLALSFGVELEDTGLNVKAIIPYVRIVVRLIPTQWGWLNWARRRPAVSKRCL